jgi:hypothetical protein
MKNLKLNFLIILFLVAGTFTLKAQTNEFAPIGAKWHYDGYQNSESQIYTTIESIKDTIVQGKNCRLLKQLFYKEKNVLSDDPERSYIIYSDSGIVYLWQDTAFITLMNFNLNVGQSWRYKLKDGTFTEIVVRKVDTITIGTQKRKVLQIRNFDESFSTIIEGIGSVKAFTPDEDFIDHQTRTEWIRCYQDSTIFYKFQPDISCDTVFTAGIEELNHENKPGISISPNPFQNQVYIKLINFPANPGFTNITVFSAEGKVVYETNSPSEEITVPLSQLPQGIYHARIKNADTIIFKKLIKM